MVTVASFVDSVRNLPSLPSTYMELKYVCDHPRKGVDDISEIISRDQSLASRLLQMANSAFYGFPRRIESIPDAVGKIGITQIQSLVLATSVMDTFRHISPLLLDMKKFWRHSLSCGIAAGLLARKTNGAIEPESLFVGGLLHDIGRLVIYLKSPGDAKKVMELSLENRVLETQTEIKSFGFDHAEIGAALIERWNLPKSLVEMVRYHHRPSRAVENPLASFTVHWADFIVSGLRMGESGELFVAPFEVQSQPLLLLSPQQFEELVFEIDQDSQQLCEIFCR